MNEKETIKQTNQTVEKTVIKSVDMGQLSKVIKMELE
mgnify:CR=1 FL=1